MHWVSTLSREQTIPRAVAETCGAVLTQMGGRSVDLVLIFASPELGGDFAYLGRLIQQQLGSAVLVGCAGGGLIAQGQEIEDEPGLVVTAAHLPGVTVTGFHLEMADLPDLDAPPLAWQERLGVMTDGPFLLMAGGGMDLEVLLAGLDYAFPTSPKLGGIASGSQPLLFLNEQCHTRGVNGVALRGNIAMDPLVAQGCRPLGQKHEITGCEDYLLTQLDGMPPVEVLGRVLGAASQRDRQLAQRNALFVGLLADEFKQASVNFLIRNLMGVDRQRGALAIGQPLRVGQTLQFHIRDGAASSEDLDQLLHNYVANSGASTVQGCVLFSCLGRGESFYGSPNHDAQAVQRHLGAIPVGGFFCNGEIGPVGATTYLHGYTAAIGFFRPLS
ncbi:FIST C-terminal domain-containing protein [Candidatus Cyanaurora vandensis]|uniref:FIST signal transduction protein n=1 Tax=Candidatus Cyanaurora vandensis TaxID=2714958 RepID=UPI00257C277F|nr:FIST C-terminal domain-containing protein [Candidatus Cyanaurora vandensis]